MALSKTDTLKKKKKSLRNYYYPNEIKSSRIRNKTQHHLLKEKFENLSIGPILLRDNSSTSKIIVSSTIRRETFLPAFPVILHIFNNPTSPSPTFQNYNYDFWRKNNSNINKDKC